jgi:hypothetical protein
VKLAARVLLAASLLAAAGGGVAALAARGRGAARVPSRWTSSAQCRECHGREWAQWHGSHHQIAFQNPEVRKLSDDFRNKECQACHLPRPVFEVGLGKRTLPRITRPDEGVDCLTCHLAADGGLVGRTAAPDAPCRPRAEPAFASVELCATCHNQHQTTDQFRASPFAHNGGHCNDCHMPDGRGHAWPGAHDPEFLRAAATFEVRRDGGVLAATVANVGAGHNFPTEERHRAVDVEVRFVQADGSAGAWQRLFRFRQPYRDEPGENTQLPAGEHKTVTAPVPAGAVRAEARLWYRLNPFATDDQPASTLLYERAVELP